MPLRVNVDYPDLFLGVRKGLTARQVLQTKIRQTLRSMTEVEQEDHLDLFDSVIATITLPHLRDDAQRLDVYVDQKLAEAGFLPLAPKEERLCVRCTGHVDAACNGGPRDAEFLNRAGSCIATLRRVCELAIAAARSVYADVPMPASTDSVAVVKLASHADCPTNAAANYCVAGKSNYEDDDGGHRTIITVSFSFFHWHLESYAALLLILAHELVCHAAFGCSTSGRRPDTMANDAFVEGWMDYVARSRAKAGVDEGDAAWSTYIDEVDGVISQWRNSRRWMKDCDPKKKDLTAMARARGQDHAAYANRFLSKRHPGAFERFSAAFNAAGAAPEFGDALFEELEVARGPVGNFEEQPIVLALLRFAEDRKIDAFLLRLAERRNASRE